MQILPENLKILTWIFPDFYLSFTVGGFYPPPQSPCPWIHACNEVAYTEHLSN